MQPTEPRTRVCERWHAVPGVGGQTERFGTEFSTFFSCPEGSTPTDLLQDNLYSEIAIPFKGGEWRKPSMVLFGLALSAASAAEDVEVLSSAGLSAHTLKMAGKAARTRLRRQVFTLRRSPTSVDMAVTKDRPKKHVCLSSTSDTCASACADDDVSSAVMEI
jgi:hypothetical protein